MERRIGKPSNVLTALTLASSSLSIRQFLLQIIKSLLGVSPEDRGVFCQEVLLFLQIHLLVDLDDLFVVLVDEKARSVDALDELDAHLVFGGFQAVFFGHGVGVVLHDFGPQEVQVVDSVLTVLVSDIVIHASLFLY